MIFLPLMFLLFLDKSIGTDSELPERDGEIVALIKPQFEAGREKVGKKGVVREKSTHHEVIEKVALYAQSIGFEILNIDFSPIKGPGGKHRISDPSEEMSAAGRGCAF